ncbi:MAG: 3-phosphoshikimate 1-carboxyvinyltransferase [Candidatus Omnitrophica bacterium]|nr:3-phosphoshikimate 1-carboxyvinyltransferase [Candidatus Omnitrophota bacterium]MBU1048319.1 3-phosphoshikimate 1-carboxyvinyltransferase [Candidatus Omnitrophota bacterium]MBU1630286.1 3-phosphoshikimate 1-carboxyvinyltransferase [Candidatus Omnitrophota bacterium]MBU1889699.1 3-phosphoshikimate 1-carboxyvinyltransferase [Candidatus Omnitrophota bacterium]
MNKSFIVKKSILSGRVEIPPSKSHTIRAVAIASLAKGESKILYPLVSEDTLAAVESYKALGAKIQIEKDLWIVEGFSGNPVPIKNLIDTKNSGTTLNIVMSSCALLQKGEIQLTGDEQTKKRPVGPLVQSLNNLGASISYTEKQGFPPLIIKGKLTGGKTTLSAQSSQYLTSLLINTPLADNETLIDVPLLYEKSYIEMTLEWLKYEKIKFENEDMRKFRIPGNQSYPGFKRKIPSDFSSATFFLAAGALMNNDITCLGLDFNDPQGDKAVIDYLKRMGAKVEIGKDFIRISAGSLKGIDIDMNDTPDALPMMAVIGCFAKGKTRLLNVPQARIKETDRIKTMYEELSKMGAKIRELKDGLEIDESTLKATRVNGHSDHRIVMALAIAGLAIEGETTVDTAESVAITFSNFENCVQIVGGSIKKTNSDQS